MTRYRFKRDTRWTRMMAARAWKKANDWFTLPADLEYAINDDLENYWSLHDLASMRLDGCDISELP